MSKEVPFYHYIRLWSEIRRRTRQPFRRPSFLFFVILAIIAGGGFGVWWEVGRFIYAAKSPGTEAIRTALLTVFPATAGPAVLQLIYVRAEKEFLSATIFVLSFILVVSYAICLAPTILPGVAILVGLIAWAVSIWLWIIANADEAAFNAPDDTAPLGGDPTATPAGNLNQYKH